MITGQSIDVAIGLVTAYLAVAIICSSINELLAAALDLRAQTLEEGIRHLLGSLADQVLAHPLIENTSAPDKKPSYVDPAIFAAALLDEITKGLDPAKAADIGAIRVEVNALPDGSAKKSLLAFLDMAKGSYDKLVGYVSTWFDSHMDRISGGYKRRAQTIVAICALIVVVILNVDSINIFTGLISQPAVAAAIADRAQQIAGSAEIKSAVAGGTAPDLGAQIVNVNKDLQSLELPIGWHRDDLTNPFLKIVGLLITAIAASLGAPFWFDVLGKLANMRATGDKPDTKKPATT